MSNMTLTTVCCAAIAIGGFFAGTQTQPTPHDAGTFLTKRVGNWTYTIRYEQGGALKAEAKGEAVFTSELDGQFILGRFTIDFFGKTASALQVHSYNATAKRFEAMWAFSKSPAMVTLTGTASDDGKSVRYRGTEQAFPDRVTTTDAVVTMTDDDHFTTVMTRLDSLDGIKVTETYTRKK